jgi:hypothetical protein
MEYETWGGWSKVEESGGVSWPKEQEQNGVQNMPRSTGGSINIRLAYEGS